MTETDGNSELVFVALGGLGEIGMNCAAYGYGPPRAKKWLVVDLGMTFAGESAPGVDLVYPDLAFLEERRKDVVGIVITHAHEDHIGALADLWPRLKAPVYATPFAAELLRVRRLSEPGAPNIPLHAVEPGSSVEIGPFGVEFVSVAHSIPEACALAIRTPAGLAVHSGDWKLDADPVVGGITDEARLRELGEEGVLALVGDSTNVMREGTSPSERDVANAIRDLVASSPQRVAFTLFASNVARIRGIAEAARAAGREVVIVGRAMQRVVDVARERGFLDGIPAFRGAREFGYLARDKVVLLLTGSQGEPRAALARTANKDHPDIALSPGDRVVFSSRTIPGNERPVGAIINALIGAGVEVITDRTQLVHVSGHPRREEVEQLYAWLRPRVAVPAHGEALHLFEHAALARALGVPHVMAALNGEVIRFAPGEPGKAGRIESGRMLKDGEVLISPKDPGLADRRRLAESGVITVALAVDERGALAGDPELRLAGLPAFGRDGKPLLDVVLDTVEQTAENLPRGKRRDPDALAQAVERAVRAAVNGLWGKKPQVHVLVVEV